MPLPMKTLREVAAELGMSEAEIRTLVDLRKVRAVIKRGVMTFAPDEIARMKRERKTIPESAAKSSGVPAAAPVKTGAAARSVPPSRPATPSRTARPIPPRRVPPPPPG